MGNLRNVRRAVEELGAKAVITGDPDVVARAEKVILPGVGAFGEAVRRIDRLGLREPLMMHAQKGTPLLGICLGMQLLFSTSEESPGANGLGVFEGNVRKFDGNVKVPHIGWNDVAACARSWVFGSPGDAGCFYFVHSYYVPEHHSAVATTSYGQKFSSAVERENVAGVQFHPEKSQEAGLKLLKNFIDH
jgi:imidazole glycerol phosphate synthase glutamine amidotransferase subunit